MSWCQEKRNIMIWVSHQDTLTRMLVPEPTITDAREGYATWAKEHLTHRGQVVTIMDSPVVGLQGRQFKFTRSEP